VHLESFQRRTFWQDTLKLDDVTLYVQYSNGMLLPTIVLPGRGRRYPAAVPACLFIGPDAPDQREWEMGLISSALGTAAKDAAGQAAQDAAFEKQCPVLFAFMTVLEEEGAAREPSSLVIFTEDGAWKGCLSEKNAGVQLWRTADSFQKLLQALEKALASGQADWRKRFNPDTRGKRGKGK
jgi:hypothetical protein